MYRIRLRECDSQGGSLFERFSGTSLVIAKTLSVRQHGGRHNNVPQPASFLLPPVLQQQGAVCFCAWESDLLFRGEAANLSWFALRVRSRYENIVAAFLGGKGYEWFLPTYFCKRQWSDRIKKMELPLFPGYLFCRFDPQDRLPILETPALISIVGIGKTPIPVDESEIKAVRTLVGSGLHPQPWPYVKIGQRVRIEYGALFGIEGILQSFKGSHRIVVSVSLLQRSVAAEIDSAWVTPIETHSVIRRKVCVPAITNHPTA
jgi:transcription antitermination factor NusG